MDIIINLINVMSERFNNFKDKIDEMDDKNIINMVLSKLEFCPNHYKILKKDNKIFIKCHTFYINIFNDNSNFDEIKMKVIEYNQPMIYSHTKNSCMPPPQYYNEIINNIDSYKTSRNPNLYLCIKYCDIIIDLETKNYKITKANFNIRKPTDDKSKLFETIINNINNPSYYFIFNYDLNSINESYSDIRNYIYDFKKISLSFSNDDNNIDIDVIMPIISSLSNDIDTKPLVSNQIKINIINGGFI